MNKTIIITGSNSGIGFELARKLISEDYFVILACRNKVKGLDAEKKLGKKSKFMEIDLSSYKSIDIFSDRLRNQDLSINYLVNNAGVMFHPNYFLKNGINITFFVNYIGYYYLSLKLIDILEKNYDSKIINISSISSYSVKEIDWSFFNPKNTIDNLKYKRELYSYTNLFRLMFSIELSNKLKQRGFKTKSIACHPGVVKSNLGRYVLISKIIYSLPILPPTKVGVKPIYESITNTNFRGGEFIGFDSKNQWKGNPKIVSPNPLCNNENLRKILWGKTKELTGIDI
ncbi:MAG: hypothetical protein CL761_05475 [Chloroflexi bacterium]|mgnify:CR=1 FL=1|nr:hypothetical protein [Chloroflexota bacterium]|tara:strand:+ start:4883 stop:5740 length:858 start_codon:yes stop_codon:yes gene_type:complete